MKYAHIKDGVILRIKELTAEEVADIPAHKASYLFPYVDAAPPPYDSATHHAAVRQPGSRVGDAVTASDMAAQQVNVVYADPVAKTAQELDAEKDAVADAVLQDRLAKVAKLIMTGQFHLINDVRARHGQGAINVTQYFNWIDGLPTITDAEFKQRIKDLL